MPYQDGWDHGAINKFEPNEVSNALSNAFEQAADVTHALSDVVNGKEPNNRRSDSGFDDETLKSIMNDMVGSIKVPHLDKVTKDCVSALLRNEIQAIVNDKISRAKETIGISQLPESGRVTRTRSRRSSSTRSDSPHTITPTSSWEERGDIRDDSHLSGGWAAYCNGCFDGCDQCLPDVDNSEVHLYKGWRCNDPDRKYGERKKSKKSKKVSTESRSSSKRHGSSKTSSRVPGKHARRERRRSATSSESDSPIVRRAKAMCLNDDSDSDNTSRVPGPKIYTATTASSNSNWSSVLDLNIQNLDVQDVWDDFGDRRRRQGKVTWSNGSTQVMWMDDLSKKYPQQLINYYEKPL